MVGTASFRLRFRGASHCLTSVALSKSHYSSPLPYFIQVIGKRHVASPIVFRYRSQSRAHHQQTVINAEQCGRVQASSSLKRSCCHTSACTEAGHELRCATIWHGLLPSHHPSILNQSSFRQTHYNSRFPAPLPSPFVDESGWLDRPVSAFRQLHASAGGLMQGLSLPNSKVTGLRKFSMAAASWPDGSWNVAWDARPARWLHGRDSAWLLFGVCNCVSAVSGMLSPKSPSYAKAISDYEGIVVANKPIESDVGVPLQQQSASVGYNVTGIPMDGRCLFRAIAYGACARSGEPVPSESLQQVLADDLRNKVVDELVSRRSESEWFIEEDFDSYVTRMREPYVWGGEPELLMASHVLKMPITVHLLDKSSKQLLSVAEYGKEYGSENPIRVLYHGFGHYDALHLEGDKFSTLV